MQASNVNSALNPALNPALSPNNAAAPSSALSPGLSAAGVAGPGGGDSFSRLLEAADARRQTDRQNERQTERGEPAASPAAKAGPARPPAPAAKAPATPEARAQAGSAPQDTRTDEAASAEAPSEPPAAPADSTAPDAAALLASLGLVLRPTGAPETTGSRGRGLAAGAATEAGLGGAAGSDNTATAALGGTTGRRGGAGAEAGGDAGRTETAFTGLLAQAGSNEAGSTSAAWATDTQALAAQQPANTGASAELRPADGSALLLAGGAAVAGTGTPGSSASSPAEARLSHTPGHAAFADELGAQISTFVRDGVQHAKLQLHPLELGPVTVQIQLDGGSAHMSFAAEHAQTRQALEQALPTLASSLREAGLTLSGGGVFEQPRQAQPDSGNGGGNGSGRGRERGSDTADTGSAATAAGTAAARRRGVVDLVA